MQKKLQNIRAFALCFTMMALVGFVAVSQTPSNSDTLIIDTISLPETLDPAWSFFTADSAILEQVYDHLIDFDGSAIGEFVPELATEVPSVANGGISADLKTYTFNIRDGVTFHDGTVLTCADVEYSFERVMAMDRDSGPSLLLLVPALGISTTRDADGNLVPSVMIDGASKSLAQAIDEAVECSGSAFSFHFTSPLPVATAMLQLFAHASLGSAYSKTFAVANGAADNANRDLFLALTNGPTDVGGTTMFNRVMGTGPFRLSIVDRAAQQTILARYDGYWQGAAVLKNVIWNNVGEFTTRLLRLIAGDADVSYLSERNHTQRLLDQRPSGVRLYDGLPGFVTESFHINKDIQGVDTGNQYVFSGACDGNGIPADFFASLEVRSAFAHAFNQEQFIEDFLLGGGVVAATPIPQGIDYFDPSVDAIAFDLAQTEADFKAATCTGSDKSVWETGFKFVATHNSGNSRRRAALDQLELNVEGLNAKRAGLPKFDIVIQDVAGSIFFNPNQQRISPIFVGGWSPDFVDIDNWIRQWMDSQAGTFSAVTGLDKVPGHEHWVAILNEAVQPTVTVARRAEIYAEIQRAYVDNAVAITMPTRTLDNVERTWVDGNYYNPVDGDPQEPPDVYSLSKKAGGTPNYEETDPYISRDKIIDF